jgi:hypothetical protein
LEGYWSDAGTFSSCLKANILRASLVDPQILNHVNLKELIEDLF